MKRCDQKLVRLAEMPVQVAEKQREPHLTLANFEPRISGSGGCNRVTGSFELDGDELRLRGVAGTMMACLAGMEQEQRFLQSIGKVECYRISGSHLEMLDAGGAVIARFEAVALRRKRARSHGVRDTHAAEREGQPSAAADEPQIACGWMER